MASSVEICNLALTKVGAARITALTDDTKQAKALNAIFDAKRDLLLSLHPWGFAIKRAQIPASSTAPEYGWTKRYPLPSDFLKIVQVGDQWAFYDAGDLGALFEQEGGAILTDEPSPLQMRYVYRVTNSGLFTAPFVEAFASLLAAEVCEELTQNLSKRQAAQDEFKQAIRNARRANAIERPPVPVPDSSWVRAMTEG